MQCAKLRSYVPYTNDTNSIKHLEIEIKLKKTQNYIVQHMFKN
jgi:hypothetical protein